MRMAIFFCLIPFIIFVFINRQYDYFSWEINGGRVDVSCGEIYQANSLVFDGPGKRQACTPYMDTRSAGNLRFYFGFGMFLCEI